MSLHLNVFDNKVPYLERDNLWRYCTNSTFRLGWEDTDEPEKYDLNMHSHWSSKELESNGILPHFKKCIDETECIMSITIKIMNKDYLLDEIKATRTNESSSLSLPVFPSSLSSCQAVKLLFKENVDFPRRTPRKLLKEYA